MSQDFLTQAPLNVLEDYFRRLDGPPLPMFFNQPSEIIVSPLSNNNDFNSQGRLQDVEFKNDHDSNIRCFYYVMLEVCFSSVLPADLSANVLQKFKQLAYRTPISISPQGLLFSCHHDTYRLREPHIMKLLVNILDLAPYYKMELPKLINLFPVIDTVMILFFRSFCCSTATYANSAAPVHTNCLMDFIRYLGIQCTILLNKMIVFDDLQMTYIDNGMSCQLRYIEHGLKVEEEPRRIRQVTVESIDDSDGSMTSYIVGSEYEPHDQLLKMCKMVKSIRKKRSLRKNDSRAEDFDKDGSFHLNIRLISQQSQEIDSQEGSSIQIDQINENVQSIIIQSPQGFIKVFDVEAAPVMSDLNGISSIKKGGSNVQTNILFSIRPVCLEGVFNDDQNEQDSPMRLKIGSAELLQKTNDRQHESDTKEKSIERIVSSLEQLPPIFLTVKKSQKSQFDRVYVRAGEKSVSFDRRKSLTSTLSTPRPDMDGLCTSPLPIRQFRSEIGLRFTSPYESIHSSNLFSLDTKQQLLH